jgi:hypothetical protein
MTKTILTLFLIAALAVFVVALPFLHKQEKHQTQTTQKQPSMDTPYYANHELGCKDENYALEHWQTSKLHKHDNH